jgi:biotin operon repressor
MKGLNTRVGEMEARLLQLVRRAALSNAELAEALGISEKASAR